MNEAIDKSIEALTKAAESAEPNDALKLTQAALNLAHVKSVLHQLKLT